MLCHVEEKSTLLDFSLRGIIGVINEIGAIEVKFQVNYKYEYECPLDLYVSILHSV